MLPSAVRRGGLALGVVGAMLAAVVGVAPAAAAATPKLRVYDATLTEGTGGQAIVAFAVQLSAKATKAVTFTWRTKAVVRDDPGGLHGGRRAAPRRRSPRGSISTVLIVRVAADAIDEYSETFGVTISGASGATIATLERHGDDPRRRRAPGAVARRRLAVVEGTDTAPVSAPGHRVAVAGQRQADLGPLRRERRHRVRSGRTWSAARRPWCSPRASRAADFSVDLVGDDTDEATEAFGLTWAAPLNVQLPARVSPRTLLDDDGPLRPAILGSTPAQPEP